MIRANIDAAIEAKIKERDKNWENIRRLDSIIEKLKVKKSRLLDHDTDLYYELEELEDELYNDNNNWWWTW